MTSSSTYIVELLEVSSVWIDIRLLPVLLVAGGLVFILVWFMFLLLWSIPVIIIEYSVGRYTRKGPVESFATLLGKNYRWLGGWVFMVTLGIW